MSNVEDLGETATLTDSYTGEEFTVNVQACAKIKKQAYRDYRSQPGMGASLSDVLWTHVRECIAGQTGDPSHHSYDVYNFIVYTLEVY